MNDGNGFKPQRIAGLTAWACSYDGPDGRYGITLYGSDPKQILDDNCDALPGLTVEGVVDTIIPAKWPGEDSA